RSGMNGQYVESMHIGAQRVSLKLHKSPLCPACSRCGHVWTEEEKKTDGVNQHMVDAHGFKRVGAQVFLSLPCIACNKPGLYKVGIVAYCKDHVQIGKSRL